MRQPEKSPVSCDKMPRARLSYRVVLIEEENYRESGECSRRRRTVEAQPGLRLLAPAP